MSLEQFGLKAFEDEAVSMLNQWQRFSKEQIVFHSGKANCVAWLICKHLLTGQTFEGLLDHFLSLDGAKADWKFMIMTAGNFPIPTRRKPVTYPEEDTTKIIREWLEQQHN